jgi:hypothetical protein
MLVVKPLLEADFGREKKKITPSISVKEVLKRSSLINYTY